MKVNPTAISQQPAASSQQSAATANSYQPPTRNQKPAASSQQLKKKGPAAGGRSPLNIRIRPPSRVLGHLQSHSVLVKLCHLLKTFQSDCKSLKFSPWRHPPTAGAELTIEFLRLNPFPCFEIFCDVFCVEAPQSFQGRFLDTSPGYF